MLTNDICGSLVLAILSLVFFLSFFTQVQCSILQWEQNDDCSYNPFIIGRLRGDNDYQLIVDELEGGLESNKTYTVSIAAKTQDSPERAFQSWSLLSVDDFGRPAGKFHVDEGAAHVSIHRKCKNKVSSFQREKQRTFAVEWSSDNEISTNCVYFRATIHVSGSVWFSEDGSLTAKLCRAPAKDKKIECCACGVASYSITFKGLWSKETHPRDWPPESLVHWGNIVGAVHNENFTLWRSGQHASEGMKHLALYGSSSLVESDLAQRLQNSDDIREIVLMDGRWTTKLNEPTSTNISVSNSHHMLSLASMFGPSPDWFSGIDSLSLCNADCTWKTSQLEILPPFDAGVDAGVTYVGNKVPQIPAQRITQITPSKPNNQRSPFYNPGGSIPAMAHINIERIGTYGTQCPNGIPDETIPTMSMQEFEKFRASYQRKLPAQSAPVKPKRKRPYQIKLIDQNSIAECAVTPWSDWSECHPSSGRTSDSSIVQTRTREYKDATLAKKFHCQQVLVQERPCADTTTDNLEIRCPTSDWSEWSKCSNKCGLGKKHRSRKLISNDARCKGKVKLRESMECTGNDPSCSSGLKLDMFEKKRVCMQPISTGPCKDFEERYYLDFESRKCKPFKYGGCGGNENNFKTIEDCENVCDILLLGKTSSGVDSRCVTLPWSEWSECSNSCGPGVQTRHRQYKSKPLALGFCGEILHESRPCNGTKCDSPKYSSNAERLEVCTSPIEPGPCGESITRYYYDTITKSCLPFKYGGCFGNANNFASLSDCERICLHNEDESAIRQSPCGYYMWTPWSPCKKSLDGKLIQTRKRKLVSGSASASPKCRKFAAAQQIRICHTIDNEDTSTCEDKSLLYLVTMSKSGGNEHGSAADKLVTHHLDAIVVTHSPKFSLTKWSTEEFILFEDYLRDGFTEPVIKQLQSVKSDDNAILEVKEFPMQNIMEQRIKVLVDTAHPIVSIFSVALVNQSNILQGILDMSLLSQDGLCKWVNQFSTLERLDVITKQFPECEEDYSLKEANTNFKIQSSEGKLHVKIDKLRDVDEGERNALFVEDPRCDLTDWTEWSPCSVSCGKGIQIRARSYRSMKTAVEAGCNAALRQSKICYGAHKTCDDMDKCRTTEWSAWSPCSTTCGVGVTTRIRSFTDLSAAEECKKLNVPLVEKRPCQAAVEQCNKPASSLEKIRAICHLPLVDGSPCRSDLVRFYYNHSTDECTAFRFGGCNQNANNFETKDRCEKTCKGVGQVLCTYGNWSDWSECSKDCGGGIRTRTRQLVRGGKQCNATETKTEQCNVDIACDSAKKECGDLPWSGWTNCVGPCGGEGVQRREQIRIHGDKKCPILREFRFCTTPAC